MFGDMFSVIISLLYLVGGITIGYYIPKWIASRKIRGDGRWD
jgi:glycerol-3-phosphate acyltransferase PlsY